MRPTASEIGALVAAVVLLVVVMCNMPKAPVWPTDADFHNEDFNPFVGNPKYRAPECGDVAVNWDSRDYGKCPSGTSATSGAFPTDPMRCGDEDLHPLLASGQMRYMNFTAESTGGVVSALVFVPESHAQLTDFSSATSLPVVYALHARDQAYESAEENFLPYEIALDQLHKGIKGWIFHTLCALNSPDMQPHIIVFPMRGGDRMWIDCKDPSECALETHIVQEIVPRVTREFNTIDDRTGRACIGYSMGASGCLNLVLKYPDVFSSTVVQSPGVFPRFVEWDELVSTEGQKSSKFSTRDFLIEKVFDGKADYESKNVCNMLSSQLRTNKKLKELRPKIRVWFGMRDPYIAQDEALFGCMACNQMCIKFHIVMECAHGGFFQCLEDEATSSYPTYLDELHSMFQ